MQLRLVLLLLLLSSSFLLYAQKTTLSVQVKDGKKDTVQCVLMINNARREFEFFPVPLIKGNGTISLPIQRATFFTITDGVNYLKGIIEPGDNLLVQYNEANPQPSLSFNGKGKEKSQLFKLINELKLTVRNKATEAVSKKETLQSFFHFMDKGADSLHQLIDNQKTSMSKRSTGLLHAEIAGNTLVQKYFFIGQFLNIAYQDAVKSKEISLAMRKQIKDLLHFRSDYAGSDLYTSQVFSVLNVFTEESSNWKNKNMLQQYTILKRMLPQKLRPAVLTQFLTQQIRRRNYDSVQQVAELMITDKVYKNYVVQQLAKAQLLKEGDMAPDFLLEDEQGLSVNLSFFKGKVVYMDFWFAACIPCQELFQQTDELKRSLENDTSIVFLNISIDTKEVWKKAINGGKIKGMHVYTGGKGRNHSIVTAYNVQSYPTNFIIDRNGRINSASPSHDPDKLTLQLRDAMSINSSSH